VDPSFKSGTSSYDPDLDDADGTIVAQYYNCSEVRAWAALPPQARAVLQVAVREASQAASLGTDSKPRVCAALDPWLAAQSARELHAADGVRLLLAARQPPKMPPLTPLPRLPPTATSPRQIAQPLYNLSDPATGAATNQPPQCAQLYNPRGLPWAFHHLPMAGRHPGFPLWFDINLAADDAQTW
jgi:hypothetical protein